MLSPKDNAGALSSSILTHQSHYPYHQTTHLSQNTSVFGLFGVDMIHILAYDRDQPIGPQLSNGNYDGIFPRVFYGLRFIEAHGICQGSGPQGRLSSHRLRQGPLW